jgi:NTP pyrophosphatase (non-canonical NTP hydrolase)
MQHTSAEIKQYLQERDWHNLKPANLAKSISIEAAELLELFQWSDETLEEVKGNLQVIEEVKKELADVLIYCFNMAGLLDFDVKEIILAKLEQNRIKFPVDVVKGNQAAYYERKKEYRRKGF